MHARVDYNLYPGHFLLFLGKKIKNKVSWNVVYKYILIRHYFSFKIKFL